MAQALRTFSASSPADFPPPSIVFGAMDTFLADERVPRVDKRALRQRLTQTIEVLENVALVDFRAMVFPPAGTVKLSLVDQQKRATAYAVLLHLLSGGFIYTPIREHAPDLLPRYAKAVGKATVKLQQLRAVLVASIANAEGKQRGESSKSRLKRAIEQARECPPIDMGDC